VTVDTAAIRTVVKRRAGITLERLVTGEQVRNSARTMLDLGAGPVYAAPTIYKNGTQLTIVTHYTWSTYASRVTLLTAAVDTDEFFITAQVKMSDTAVDDHISESADILLPALRAHYDDASLDTRAFTTALVAMRATGKVKISLCKGSRDNVDYTEGVALVKEAMELRDAVCRGEIDIIESDGDIVARRANALAGGFRNEDDLAITSRLQMVDQLQRWHGLIEYFWPESGLAISPRTFP
jgi:hypothetical protein